MKLSTFMAYTIIGTIILSCTEAANNKREQNNIKRNTGNSPAATAGEISKVQASYIYRNRGANQLTHEILQKNIKADSAPDTIHLIPDSQVDIDRQVSTATIPSKKCGNLTNHSSIGERITHCERINGSESFWNGIKNGISGEGVWRLVFNDGREQVWLDVNTKTLWSPIIDKGNWQEASGYDIESDSYTCGNIKLLPADQVRWRLPNRNEFLAADLNGARFVLKDIDALLWTASSDNNQSLAWAIEQETGILSLKEKTSSQEIRCIGTILK